jgi:hypothetical protein
MMMHSQRQMELVMETSDYLMITYIQIHFRNATAMRYEESCTCTELSTTLLRRIGSPCIVARTPKQELHKSEQSATGSR